MARARELPSLKVGLHLVLVLERPSPWGVRRNTAFAAAVMDGAVEVEGGFAGPAYGSVPEGTLEAIRLFAELEGLVLDPVYSGKGAAGLIGLIRAGEFGRGDTVVFVHTGGSPGLFAYSSLLGAAPAD